MASETKSKKPCCLVSELLEETGLDRETLRQAKRQVLQGMVMLCQWQLERMERPARASAEDGGRRARKVTLD
jgi:hypothetical protein